MTLDATRAEAARVAACVDLRDVRLWGVEAALEGVPNEAEQRLSYRFDADVQVQYSDQSQVLLVYGTYALHMVAVRAEEASTDDSSHEADDVDDDDDIASIEFRLNALFAVEHEPDEPFTDDELTAFGKTTGQFALYPYAREFVATMTGRMGLPPLHMGVMRLHLDTREG